MVLTRKQFPDWTTYEKAFKDIENSGLSPYYLMSVDQSVDLYSIPTLKPEDIDCVIDTSLFTTTTTKSLTTTTTIDSDAACTVSDDSCVTSSVDSSSTTVSTIQIVKKPDYVCPYEMDVYPLCGNIKVLMNLTPETVRVICFYNSSFFCNCKSHKYVLNISGNTNNQK